MIINMVKIFFILLLFLTNATALGFDKSSSVLSNIEIYKSSKIINIDDIDNKLFESYSKPISIGLTNSEVWVKLNFSNKTSKEIDTLVVFKSTNIDSIKVYEKNNSGYKLDNNLSNIRELERTLYPYFSLKLKAKESKSYYVNIKSTQTPSSFNISLEDKKEFFKKDRTTQFIDILIIGFLITIVIYFIFQYLNIKEKSYLFFALFVLIGLFNLFSYTGLAQIYTSKEYLLLDKNIFVIKLNIMIVLSSFFAIEFLKLSKKGYLYKLYIFIVALASLEIIAASFFNYSYYFVLLILGLYAIINIVAGLRVYFNGLKEAIFFILASVVLAFGVYVNIFNALNINIIDINSSKYMMIYALAIIFFVFGYAYRYYINKKVEFELFANEFDKKMIIEQKIREKQEELKRIESSEKMLKQNMNSIIKNNLQTTVSMLKLQEPKVEESSVLAQLKSLESRLLSIVKSYSLFLSAKNPNFIVMREYLRKLIDDTLVIYKNGKKLDITLDVDAVLGLEDAIYVGLSVVDYIINIVEDTQNQESVVISIKNSGDDYQFSIKDGDIVKNKQEDRGISWLKKVFKKGK